MATEVLADERSLREGRRRRVLAEMDAADLDVLLLGREANARYVSGAPRLWTAGTRTYGPGCVLVRSTGAIHLVSTWDEGIPEDIPRTNLFGITWNPGNLLAWLRGIDGLSEARRIGTDSLTPRFEQLLPKIFPSATLVDAEPALESARRIKTPEEIEAVRRSIGVAETALAAAVAELRSGVTERHLAATFMEAMAEHGVTTPATQRVAWISSGLCPGGTVGDSDVVSFDAGVVTDGYIGELGRTWPANPATVDAPTKELLRRTDELWSRLLDACHPGAPCRGLMAAYRDARCPLPPFPIGAGLGLGFDGPVVARSLPKTAAHERFAPGMVLAVTAQVDGERAGEAWRKEAVLITDDGPEVLTSSPRWHP
jgi:Xaa-Pro aminopeptidase